MWNLPFECVVMQFCNMHPFSDDAPEKRIQVRYDVMELPITIPGQKPTPDKPNPKQGIGKAES